MKDFFKNEWNLFLDDMQSLGELIMSPFVKEEHLKLDMPKFDAVDFAMPETQAKAPSFWAREWQAFKNDMQGIGECILAVFEEEPKLKLDAAKVEETCPKKDAGFFKNEWELFKSDIETADAKLANLFGYEKKKITDVEAEAMPEMPEVKYVKDEVDYKLETYLCEPIAELKENVCGDRTQYDVLRDYATFFKPYTEQADMCQVAFKKYYDRHALNMACAEMPVQQARIIQNNVDIFIRGQEMFGEGGQFIDSRIDGIFAKCGMEEVNKVVNILSDSTAEGNNIQGERILAEAMSYMVDNGIKVDKTGKLVSPVKKALELRLDEVHVSLKSHDDWNEEYQNLLSQERKYLYALNRIEQYETELRIAEFESKLNELDVVV